MLIFKYYTFPPACQPYFMGNNVSFSIFLFSEKLGTNIWFSVVDAVFSSFPLLVFLMLGSSPLHLVSPGIPKPHLVSPGIPRSPALSPAVIPLMTHSSIQVCFIFPSPLSASLSLGDLLCILLWVPAAFLLTSAMSSTLFRQTRQNWLC